MQDDAEQQGKAPDRIEGMQTFRLLLDIRHEGPQRRKGTETKESVVALCRAGPIRSCRIDKSASRFLDPVGRFRTHRRFWMRSLAIPPGRRAEIRSASAR